MLLDECEWRIAMMDSSLQSQLPKYKYHSTFGVKIKISHACFRSVMVPLSSLLALSVGCNLHTAFSCCATSTVASNSNSRPAKSDMLMLCLQKQTEKCLSTKKRAISKVV